MRLMYVLCTKVNFGSLNHQAFTFEVIQDCRDHKMSGYCPLETACWEWRSRSLVPTLMWTVTHIKPLKTHKTSDSNHNLVLAAVHSVQKRNYLGSGFISGSGSHSGSASVSTVMVLPAVSVAFQSIIIKQTVLKRFYRHQRFSLLKA